MKKLNNINLNSKNKENSELVIKVKDEKEIYLHYLKWRDSNSVIVCCECGRLVEVKYPNKSKPKYCEFCKKNNNIIASRNSMRNKRKG